MEDMLNLSAAEALYLAWRMEARSVSLYERAGLVFGKLGLKPLLDDLAAEEQRHLKDFMRLLQEEEPVAPERALLLDAAAGDLLYRGGLTGAVREGAFDHPMSLLTWAADEEEQAARRYAGFARTARGEAREAFLFIAAQEETHLERLRAQIALLGRERDA